MKQLVDRSMRLDEELLEELRPEIQEGTLDDGALERAFTLFGQVCNNTEEIRYEMNGMTQSFQFNLDGEPYAIAFVNGACEVFRGVLQAPTVVFSITVQTVLDIVTGKIHSSVAQMKGDIDYTGPRHDAIAFQRIFELFLDEFI